MFFRMKMNINHQSIIDYSRLYHHSYDKCKSFDKNDVKNNNSDVTHSKVFYGIYNQEPSVIGKLLLRPKSPLMFTH